MLRSVTGPAVTSATLVARSSGRSKIFPSQSILRQLRPTLSQSQPIQWRTQYSTKHPLEPTQIDREHEKKIAQQKLEARPDEVSTQSSVRHFLETDSDKPKTTVTDKDADEVLGELKSDINNVIDTVALGSVPRNAYRLGLAGTVPYLFTSLSTVYLSWNISTQWPTQSQLLNTFMFSNESAANLLHLLEPIQLGYGAVIISFLGAIHWGLELAEKTPSQPRTNFRYAVGVVAPMLAWPTLMLPIEWALTSQFGSFVALYLADANATKRGWAPQWYTTYRFVLTAIVGGSIFISLLGRFRLSDEGHALSTEGLKDTMRKSTVGGEPYANWAKKEDEERKRIHEEKEKEKKRKEQEAKKRKEAEKKLAEKEKKGEGEKGGDDNDEKKKKGGDDDKKQEAGDEQKEKPKEKQD